MSDSPVHGIEKGDLAHHEYVHDHDLQLSPSQRAEALHLSELTPEELVVQKKLRRKIDSLIMPLVILVYLMNYIDRYVESVRLFETGIFLLTITGTTMPQRACRDLKGT